MQLYTNKKAEPVIVVLLNDVLLVCRRVNGSKFRQHANANQLSVSEIVMLYAEQKCHKILGQPCVCRKNVLFFNFKFNFFIFIFHKSNLKLMFHQQITCQRCTLKPVRRQ